MAISRIHHPSARRALPETVPGGFCIIDDYQAIKACRQAVTDYRAKHGVSAEIVDIDGTGVLWRKE